MVGTVNMLVTRCRSTSRQASAQSSRSPDSSTRRRAARHLRQRVHAGAVRQRRDHQRHVVLGGAGHQVAQMVADDVLHLPMRQHARLRPAGGAGGVEEPGRMIAGDIRRLCHRRPPPPPASSHSAPMRNLQPASRVFRSCRGRVRRGTPVENVHRGAGGLSPDKRPPAGSGGNSSAPRPRRASRSRTSSPARRWSCARAAARDRHAARRARPDAAGGGLDPGGELRPGPGPVAPDDRRPVGKAPRGLQQQMREVGWSGSAQPSPGSKRSSPPRRRPC